MSHRKRLGGLGRTSALLLAAAALFSARCELAPWYVAMPVAMGLARPVYATAPAGDPRLFVVEQRGRIRVIDPETGAVQGTFLDIATRVGSQIDQGLWGLAFPSDYAESGHFYVFYHDVAGHSMVSRFVADDPASNQADPLSEVALMRVANAGLRSIGGTLQFGPQDGMLYAGFGAGDPVATELDAQRLTSLRGKIVRIDVRGGARDPYAVPADNPFVGDPDPAVHPEIWALGLHNPFRFDFDPATGDLWIGENSRTISENGRTRFEELDFAPAGAAGLNFGWPVHAATVCRAPQPNLPCENPAAPVSFTFPVHSYTHGSSCSIVGGMAYRGLLPWFHGHYVFADRCSNRVKVRSPMGASPVWTADVTPRLTADGASFAGITALSRDGYGEPHLVSRDNGRVYRIQLGLDSDHDGISDGPDNCRYVANRNQADADADGRGDLCDRFMDQPL
jgi:hypothetical protein